MSTSRGVRTKLSRVLKLTVGQDQHLKYTIGLVFGGLTDSVSLIRPCLWAQTQYGVYRLELATPAFQLVHNEQRVIALLQKAASGDGTDVAVQQHAYPAETVEGDVPVLRVSSPATDTSLTAAAPVNGTVGEGGAPPSEPIAATITTATTTTTSGSPTTAASSQFVPPTMTSVVRHATDLAFREARLLPRKKRLESETTEADPRIIGGIPCTPDLMDVPEE